MRRWVGIFSLVLATAGPAAAAEFRSFDLSEQVDGSDLIVLGTVRGHEPVVDHGGVFTDSAVAIEEVWKGSPRHDSITVRTAGGETARLVVEVDGEARLRPEERVLLFLRERDGVYRPWGMRFGKHRIEEAGGSPFVVGPLPPSGATPYPAVSVTLDELREQVSRLVRSAGSE